MHDRAGLVGDDGVILVLALERVADVAALLAAVEVGRAEIPAARPLHQVAADGGHVADLRRGRVRARLAERRPLLLHRRVRLDRRQGHQRPEHQVALVLDAVEPADGAQVDDALGRLEPLFQAVDQVDAARLDHDAGAELRDRFLEAGGIRPLEGPHRFASLTPFSLPSAASTAAGFIGSSRTRTPMALYTA